MSRKNGLVLLRVLALLVVAALVIALCVWGYRSYKGEPTNPIANLSERLESRDADALAEANRRASDLQRQIEEMKKAPAAAPVVELPSGGTMPGIAGGLPPAVTPATSPAQSSTTATPSAEFPDGKDVTGAKRTAGGWGLTTGDARTSRMPGGTGRLPIGAVAKLPGVEMDSDGTNAPAAVNFEIIPPSVSGLEFDVIVPHFTSKDGRVGPSFHLRDEDYNRLPLELTSISDRCSVPWDRNDGKKIFVEGCRPKAGGSYSVALRQALQAVPIMAPSGANRSDQPFVRGSVAPRPNGGVVPAASADPTQPVGPKVFPRQGGAAMQGQMPNGPGGRFTRPQASGGQQVAALPAGVKQCPHCGDLGRNVPPLPYKCGACGAMITK